MIFDKCHLCDKKLTIEDFLWKGCTPGPSCGPFLCIKCKTTPWGKVDKQIKQKLGYE